MTLHALHLGNNYPGSSSALAGCVPDAKNCAAFFGPYCATSTVLTGSKADLAGALRAGRKLLDRLEKPGDLALLSISGHGTREKVGGGYDEAMVFADFELLYGREMDALLSARLPGTFVAVFADCCHAQGFARGLNKPRTIPVSRCRAHKHERGPIERALRDVIYFAGCETNAYSFDGVFGGKPEGAMTHFLLRSIDLKPTETFGKIFAKLAGKKPKGFLPNADYAQQPVVIASAKNLKRTLGEFKKA